MSEAGAGGGHLADGGGSRDDGAQPALPADVPPALRAAVAAALTWLRELDEAAAVRRPR
jgi:hypothetical protein